MSRVNYSHEFLLLPHEVDVARSRLREFAAQQQNHSDQLGESMNQGAETFHDNAPAESVRDAQDILFKRAKPLFELLRHHVVVDYPEIDTNGVELGSRATISIDGSPEFIVDVVGSRSLSKETDDIEVLSYRSPLAKSIIGQKPGESIIAEIGGSRKTIHILQVDQGAIALQHHQKDQTPPTDA